MVEAILVYHVVQDSTPEDLCLLTQSAVQEFTAVEMMK